MPRLYYVYIITNRARGVLYTGVTNDLGERITAHITGGGSAFIKKYNLKKLVYFETFSDITEAIAREETEKMAARLEDCAYREVESNLGGAIGVLILMSSRKIAKQFIRDPERVMCSNQAGSRIAASRRPG